MTRSGGPDFSGLEGRHVLIALSGGADSVALAAMLAGARDALRITLSAAHLDHAIRPESAADAEWCRGLCDRLGIPFHSARVDVPAEAARAGEGLETAARRLRYDWLRQIRREVGADVIALAHHMDDEAETVLMHLARGTGPEGIGGMTPESGDLVRPLLGMRKVELLEYVRARGLGWREDATNALADTPRNALRLYGIPALEKTYPQFVRAAARYAESARAESDFVAAEAEKWLKSALREGPYGMLLRLDPPPHPALLRRALRRLCGRELDWEKLAELEALAKGARGATQLPGGQRAERGGLGLYFPREAPPMMRETPLLPEGKTRLPGLCEIEARPADPVPVRGDPLRQVLDADALAGATLRFRRAGDRFRPLGCGDRLLSDYFTDKKADRPLRDYIPLIARGERVLWVCGLGISEDAKLAPGTKRATVLECRYEFDIPINK